jgi:3-phenylpropionate/trans-cinnamate dioxygenase ferredoxin reductase subunit
VKTVVIVGTGVAGTTVAATLRSSGYDGRLVLVGSEPEAPYRRPALTKEVLRGDRGMDQIRIKPEAWYAAQDVELLTGTTVSALDVSARTVTVDGAALGWDAVVLATGGTPRLLPGSSGAHVVRTAADVTALRSHLRPGARLVVVGAGFLGAEVAATARGLDCEVTMLEAAPLPLGRLLPPPIADWYTELHWRHGVDLRTGVGIRSVTGHEVVGSDGTVYRGDAVVVAVGMQPETALASEAGLAVSEGIVVDRLGATSAPGVWAAGDAAAFPDLLTGAPRRREHWQSAVTQGTTVARNILGGDEPWAEVPWCWSDQYGVNVQVGGEPRPDDEMILQGSLEDSAFTAVFSRGGLLSGAICVDRPADMRSLRKLLASGAPVPVDSLAAQPS